MARGWESKDVESQQDERAERNTPQAVKTDLEQQLEDLNLQRTRVLHDLQAACNPRYRAMLEESLRFLENRIIALEGSAGSPPTKSTPE
ncbi:MAG: hypothetical protein FJW36_21995 [Acidobacteria bacterium]|nr:hypothetical protein [Acidobacteriota bacterium]